MVALAAKQQQKRNAREEREAGRRGGGGRGWRRDVMRNAATSLIRGRLS